MDNPQEDLFFYDSFQLMLQAMAWSVSNFRLSLYAQICHGNDCFDLMSCVEKVYMEA